MLRLLIMSLCCALFVGIGQADVSLLHFDAAELDCDGNPLPNPAVLFYLDNSQGTEWVHARVHVQYSGGWVNSQWCTGSPNNPWADIQPPRVSYIDPEGREWISGLAFYTPPRFEWAPVWVHHYLAFIDDQGDEFWDYLEIRDAVPPGVYWAESIFLVGTNVKLFHSPAVAYVEWGDETYTLYDDDRRPTFMVPEPATLALLTIGGLAMLKRRRR